MKSLLFAPVWQKKKLNKKRRHSASSHSDRHVETLYRFLQSTTIQMQSLKRGHNLATTLSETHFFLTPKQILN